MNKELLRRIYTLKTNNSPWTLDEIYAPSLLRYYATGRAALKQALRLSGVGPGDNVLFPSLICREVLCAVEELGAVVMYYRVNDNLAPKNTQDEWPVCKAVLAVNYFGFPQDLEPFKEYCSRTKAVLLEDNAHSIFSRDENGNLLGTRGDMGILSQRKMANIPNGGTLVINFNSPTAAMPEQLAYKSVRRIGLIIKLGVKYLSRQTTPWLAIKIIGLVRTIKGAPPEELLAATATANPAPESAKLWPFFAVEEEVARRIAIYDECEKIITSLGGRPVFASMPKGTCPYVYPFYAKPEKIKEIMRSAFKLGLDIFSWPSLPDEIAVNCEKFYKDIYCVRFLW